MKVPTEASEYSEAMRRWNLDAAEWLGLDPEKVFKLDVADPHPEYGTRDHVTWSALELLTPARGLDQPIGLSGSGDELTVFTGGVLLDGPDAEEFTAAIGPKPKGPWESPEAQAAFTPLRERADRDSRASRP